MDEQRQGRRQRSVGGWQGSTFLVGLLGRWRLSAWHVPCAIDMRGWRWGTVPCLRYIGTRGTILEAAQLTHQAVEGFRACGKSNVI